MEKIKKINSMLVHEAFQSKGWTMYHKFMAGNRWEKGDDIITCYHGIYKLNGQIISEDFLCEMLKIDSRSIEVCEAIAPHPINSKYGRAFLEGVRWADAHPAEKTG